MLLSADFAEDFSGTMRRRDAGRFKGSIAHLPRRTVDAKARRVPAVFSSSLHEPNPPSSCFARWKVLESMQVDCMHTSIRLSVSALLAGVFAAGVGYAQQAISAQSGMVHYIEGSVYANGKQVESRFGQFPALRAGEELRTEDGKAELLLTPGAFLRVAEHSSVRMLSNRLSDTRVEVLSGSVMVECDELLKDNALAFVFRGDTIRLEKHGLYRLDTEPAQFRVYDGVAVIQSDAGQLTVKRGKEASLDGVLLAANFNSSRQDDFYLWSRQRSGSLAYASISAAQSLLDNRTTWSSGGWLWSPLLDEFTFVPRRGICYSPFGWQFWSPVNLGYYYTPYYYPGSVSGGGYGGNAGTSAAATALVHRSATMSNARGASLSGWEAGARSSQGYGGNGGGYSGTGGGYSGSSGGGGFAAPVSSGAAAPAVIHASGSGRATQSR